VLPRYTNGKQSGCDNLGGSVEIFED